MPSAAAKFGILLLLLCAPLQARFPDPSWEIPGLLNSVWQADHPWHTLTAEEKSDRILQVAKDSHTRRCDHVLAGHIRVALKFAQTIFVRGLGRAINRTGEEFEKPEYKTVHGKGYLLPLTFIPAEDTPFTGLWAEEGHAVGRVSSAGPWPAAGVTGLAVKHLRDGDRRSANFQVMNSLDSPSLSGGFFGQAVFDPEFPFTNILPIPKNFAMRFLLWRVGKLFKPGKERTMPVEEFALADSKGYLVENPVVAERIILVPNGEFHGLTNFGDFRKRSGNLSTGKVLWTVYGLTAEQEAAIQDHKDRSFKEQLENATLMGTYVLSDRPVQGDWQNYRLHFEHSARDLLPPKETAKLEKITGYIEARTGIKITFTDRVPSYDVRAFLWRFIDEMERSGFVNYRMSWKQAIEIVITENAGAPLNQMMGRVRRYTIDPKIHVKSIQDTIRINDVLRNFG